MALLAPVLEPILGAVAGSVGEAAAGAAIGAGASEGVASGVGAAANAGTRALGSAAINSMANRGDADSGGGNSFASMAASLPGPLGAAGLLIGGRGPARAGQHRAF